MLAASISLSNSVNGRPFENAPHSVLIIWTKVILERFNEVRQVNTEKEEKMFYTP